MNNNIFRLFLIFSLALFVQAHVLVAVDMNIHDEYDASNSTRLFLGKKVDDIVSNISVVNVYYNSQSDVRWKKLGQQFLVRSTGDVKMIVSILNSVWNESKVISRLPQSRFGVVQIEFILKDTSKKLFFAGLIRGNTFILSPLQDVDMPFDAIKLQVYKCLLTNGFLPK